MSLTEPTEIAENDKGFFVVKKRKPNTENQKPKNIFTTKNTKFTKEIKNK
jgi:hypothetical protein